MLNVVLDQSPERKIAVAAINNGWRYVLQQPPVHQPVDLRTPGTNV